jgi:hypothetical protein
MTPWLHTIRRRVLWIAVGVGVTTLGVISMTTIPAWPVVGIAVATLAIVVNSMASRLSDPICLGCGVDLKGQPRGEHGTICPHCGSIQEWVGMRPGVDELASEAPPVDAGAPRETDGPRQA